MHGHNEQTIVMLIYGYHSVQRLSGCQPAQDQAIRKRAMQGWVIFDNLTALQAFFHQNTTPSLGHKFCNAMA